MSRTSSPTVDSRSHVGSTPRTTATGSPLDLPITSSAAEAPPEPVALVTPAAAGEASGPSGGELGDDVAGADRTRHDDTGVHAPEVQLPTDG